MWLKFAWKLVGNFGLWFTSFVGTECFVGYHDTPLTSLRNIAVVKAMSRQLSRISFQILRPSYANPITSSGSFSEIACWNKWQQAKNIKKKIGTWSLIHPILKQRRFVFSPGIFGMLNLFERPRANSSLGPGKWRPFQNLWAKAYFRNRMQGNDLLSAATRNYQHLNCMSLLPLSKQPDPSKVCAFNTRKGKRLLYAGLFATHHLAKDHCVHCPITTCLPKRTINLTD